MSRPPRSYARGFSLVELSLVIAILAVVATFGLEAAANFVSRTAGTLSKERLTVVDDALANFFRVYGRLPCPTAVSLPMTDTAYGLENCSLGLLSGTSIGGGLYAGGVPWRTLNLPPRYSLDGFNNRFNYVVTRYLAYAGSTAGSFGHATDGSAGIEIRTGVLEQPCGSGGSTKCQVVANASASPSEGAAYIVFSAGPDMQGAYSDDGVLQGDCAAANPTAQVDTQNCVFGLVGWSSKMTVTTIPYNVFYDNRFNAGYNQVNFFDDYVIWRRKSQL